MTDSGVVVTLAQIYADVQATRAAVEAMVPAVDGLKTEQVTHRTDIDKLETKVSDLYTEVTVLKTQAKALWALLAFIVMACTAAGGLIAAFH